MGDRRGRGDGCPIGLDQIPWNWTLVFSATSCVLTDRLEIATQFSLKGESEDPPKIETDQIIRMTLRPGMQANGEFVDDVTLSMFGTKRAIRHFTLEVRPIDDFLRRRNAALRGAAFLTRSEIDFRNETVDDCIWFYLYVKPETFARYVALIDQGAIDTILFNVGSVDGFYSEWSPSVSTDKVKVLVGVTNTNSIFRPTFTASRRVWGGCVPPACCCIAALSSARTRRRRVRSTTRSTPRLRPTRRFKSPRRWTHAFCRFWLR